MTLSDDDKDLRAETERILAVMNTHEEELLSKANVVGVAIGFQRTNKESTGNLAIVVMVSNKVSKSLLSSSDQIPVSIDGIPIDVQEVGEISAL